MPRKGNGPQQRPVCISKTALMLGRCAECPPSTAPAITSFLLGRLRLTSLIVRRVRVGDGEWSFAVYLHDRRAGGPGVMVYFRGRFRKTANGKDHSLFHIELVARSEMEVSGDACNRLCGRMIMRGIATRLARSMLTKDVNSASRSRIAFAHEFGATCLVYLWKTCRPNRPG
jgi:hypothetical protein